MRSSKAAANEGKFPNIVELVVASDELDVALNRRYYGLSHGATH